MARLSNSEFNKMYEMVAERWDAEKAKMEADYKLRHGKSWEAAMRSALEWKLFDARCQLETTRILLDRAEKKYDALMEREHGSGASF